MVDDIIGEREIVIKPLQPPIANMLCVSGGTLSGNGQVITVLNTNDIINIALKLETTPRIKLHNTLASTDDGLRILVVDDSITTRTLEQNILESKGYNVTVAINGKEAWDILQKQKFSLLITDVTMRNHGWIYIDRTC